MTSAVVVTGTDTGIGKTVFSAGLTQALTAAYWKPVQSGLAEETDSAVVARLTGCRIVPEAYRLRVPASPHYAAICEGVAIEPDRLALPQVDGPLVVEGAGGALVPLSERVLYADQMAVWRVPVIVVARTNLGTINHSLLTIEALRARGVSVLGIAFVGPEEPESQRVICKIGRVRSLGRLSVLADVTRNALSHAFRAIDVAYIREAM